MSKIKKALIYTRVSTSKQAQEGSSPEEQEDLCRQKALRLGFKESEIKVFREPPSSGRKGDRPFLHKMLQYIKEGQGVVEAVFIKNISRFTREGAGPYNKWKKFLRENNVRLIDVMGVIQQERNALEHLGFEYEWSKRSPSATAESMQAEQARDEVSTILTRMIGKEIQLEDQGYQVRDSNLGYQNKKIMLSNGKKFTIQVPHPIESKWMVTMFNLRAEGVLSDEEICERLNAMGFKTRKQFKHEKITKEIIGTQGEKPLDTKMLQKYIKRPIYCGVRIAKWTHYMPIKCPFDGLVSIETFNKANRGAIVLRELSDGSIRVDYDVKRKVRSKHNPLYPLRFVVRCPECHGYFKGSANTGKSGKKYPAYHCDRGHKNYRIPVEEFHKQIGYYLGELKFKPEFIRLFEAVAKDTWRTKQSEYMGQSIDIEKHVTELKERKKAALDKLIKVDSDLVVKELEKQIESLEKEIQSASRNRTKIELREEELQAYLKFARHFMEHPGEILVSTGQHEKLMQIWSAVFDELPTYEEILNRTPKMSLVFELGQRSEINMEWLVTPRRIELRFPG